MGGRQMAGERIPRIRRGAIGANVAAMCVIGAAIFLMANYLGYRHWRRFDWTSRQYYTLSDKTLRVLDDLALPVRVYVFYPPFTPAYQDIREILNRYAARSGKIEVEYIDPDKDPARVRFLLAKFKLPAPAQANLVVFEQGDRHKYVYDKDIIEMDLSGARFGRGPSIKAFTGEQAFTSAIINLTQEKQPLVCMTVGHGEADREETREDGLGILATLLERENTRMEPVALYETKEVPADCDLLMIVGPREPFMDEEKKALGDFLGRGGRLFVALDPRTDSGLEAFLRHWNVDVGDNLVVDPQSARRLLFMSALNLFADDYPPHDITADMRGKATLFSEVRSVSPGGANPDLRAASILRTSPQGWGETNYLEETFRFDEGDDLRGPVSFGVAVEADAARAGDGPLANLRLVVIGDSDFLSNAQITNLANASFFLNVTNWLTRRERLIAIGPKIPEQARVRLNAAQMRRVFWFSVAGLPGMGLLLGVLVWSRRRR